MKLNVKGGPESGQSIYDGPGAIKRELGVEKEKLAFLLLIVLHFGGLFTC
jgi:hypothetical protein